MDARRSATAEFGVFALESPVGTPVSETAVALAGGLVRVVRSVCLPVNHVLLGRAPLPPPAVTRVLSHPVALAKHAPFLRSRFRSAELVPVEDTGAASRELAGGRYGDSALVIALASAAAV